MLTQVLANISKAPQVFFAKNTIRRKKYSFDVDLAKYSISDYDQIIEVLRQVEAEVLSAPKSNDSMHWVHFKDTVYFYGERVFELPFDDFVQKVDIAHAGDFYRDSVGLVTRVVQQDQYGRPTYQGARIIALPQPNYAAFMGKGELDVYKLEKVEYSQNEHRVWMKTVHSPNGSAACDDGYLMFQRTANNQVKVVFLACQSFPAPPLMAVLFLDRWTWFKDTLTEAAYRSFCNRMMKNIEACYKGEKFKVGRASIA
ncbi:hypothetical protein PSECIP111951_00151 [Pseudoalteromonas holothuriae]|uniref:Uncharacterized protein n=1 Tax=Pseudoalteromonas holothuriae TaxID=2963714 RepID=A0A9W4QTE4_9GAMM|nr:MULTISPECIES: hypothetical protein [unclassified Pseudoalteromonas]CAH9050245.1 hypothetical protein PSECIP111951_00151 [Pseudoalteromonas sp. CIP111951]CAH9052427.1 hypothetical protein PSECIP111854_00968 [Pseudoalteromonas sp. CIP111854]